MIALLAAEDVVVKDAVSRALHEDAALASASKDISESVSKGTLTLTGTVPSEAAHHSIINRVQKIPGVDRVQDRLQIGS